MITEITETKDEMIKLAKVRGVEVFENGGPCIPYFDSWVTDRLDCKIGTDFNISLINNWVKSWNKANANADF